MLDLRAYNLFPLHHHPRALIMAMTSIGTSLETVADLIDYAQCYFPEAYAKLPVPKPSLLVDFRCTCCSVQFEGIYIGQVFVKDIHGPCTNHDDVVKMVATFGAHCGQDIRVYLIQSGELFDYSSYSIKEANDLAGNYRFPFHLLAPKPRVDSLEALFRYSLHILGACDNL
jgi:hypothetical protein